MSLKRSMLCGALLVGAAFVLLLSFSSSATARPTTTCVWPDSTTGSWLDAGTWSCGAVPGPADDVSIGLGSTINLTTSATINNLTLTGGGATITGTGAITVTGTTNLMYYATISTHGSRLPRLISSAGSGVAVRVTDPALTADSFNAVTISHPIGSNGSTIFEVGPHNIGTLMLQNGNFGVTSDLTVTQILSWTNGSLNAYFNHPARFTLASTAVMTVGPSETGISLWLPLINNGTITWLGALGLSVDTKGTWTNNGTLNINTTPLFQITLGQSSVPFTNTGLLRVSAVNDVNIAYDFINYGQVEINSGVLNARGAFYLQRGGHTRLAGGNLAGPPRGGSFDSFPIRLEGGLLSGSGIITGGIDNRGGAVLLTGVLTATNSYVQSVTGTLQVTLTGATNFGVMKVIQRNGSPGSINIDGTLIVNKSNGFNPASGDRFQIMTGVTANGAFQQSTGNMAPAFSGYAGFGEVIVAEPDNAALVQARPLNVVGTRGADNGYAIAVFNPTTRTLTVSNVSAYLPISFTYKPGSTVGAITANPSNFILNERRTLLFSPGFTITARNRREFSFGLTIPITMPVGSYPLSVDANTVVNSQSRLVKLIDVAPIEIPLGAASNIALGGGTVITQGGAVSILIPRAGPGINIRARVTCPPELAPCGNLLSVFVAQELNGRGVTSFTLQLDPNQNPRPNQASDFSYWSGFITKDGLVPGLTLKLFPDWDARRPCIAYDFSGYGIRPIGCVNTGDPLGTPELYDPSGIIRDAATLQPIAGATVTLQRVPGALPDTPALTRDCRTIDTRPGGVWTGTAGGGIFEQPGFVPAQISPNVNPQITGADGRYGWNVVTGCWYVTVAAPGYASKISPLVGVPPEVTDLDLTLTALDLPNKSYLPLLMK
jgi:hypothetical protein